MEIPGANGLIAGILNIFKEKAYIYVEVCFGAPKPYALTVVNRSNFKLVIEHLIVTPDGFPNAENGWTLNVASLFKQKALAPGQKIRFLFRSIDIGDEPLRKFTVRYNTVLFGRTIRRPVQTTEYNFDDVSNRVRVSKTVTF